MPKKISIYGAGYVGLVTALCFAELGYDVLLIDSDQQKINALSQGHCTFFEPDLEFYLKRGLEKNRIAFSTDMLRGIEYSALQFITVGTPSAADGSADLTAVFNVAESIAVHMNEYRVIIIKSTVPIGTSAKIKNHIQEIITARSTQIEFDVIANPEFLTQGNAIKNFLNPDRTILGVDSDRALSYLFHLYDFVEKDCIFVMDFASAELTKYAANAYLAMRISFVNEMSQLAEGCDADIELVRRGMGADMRIGQHFLFAGCGFGGSCFPKDVSALKYSAQTMGYHSHLLHAVEAVNQQQKQVLFKKLSMFFDNQLSDKVIAIWGLSFKPNTDDMREASSRVLIEALLAAGAKIQAFDPAAEKIAMQIFGEHPNFRFGKTAEAVLENADVLTIVTEWNEFRHPDFEKIKNCLNFPAIFDGRNLYDTEELAQYGLQYYGIGRGISLNTLKKISSNNLSSHNHSNIVSP